MASQQFCFCLILMYIAVQSVTCQIKEVGGTDHGMTFQDGGDFFRIKDDTELLLNSSYCLKSIKVRAYLLNNTLDNETGSDMCLDIIWESDNDMISLSVESNSLNDSYCDSKGKFSLHRKPLQKGMHTFPDIVNHGSRFIPLKLDCSYIVVPEMVYHCKPLRLLYKAPACLSGNKCSCRTTSLPGPNLKISVEEEGFNVYWDVSEDMAYRAPDLLTINVMLGASPLILTNDQAENEVSTFSSEMWDFTAARKGNFFFAINSTYSRTYIFRAFYTNVFHCSGNWSEFKLVCTVNRKYIAITCVIIYVLICAVVLIVLSLSQGRGKCFIHNVLCSEEPERRNGAKQIDSDHALERLVSVENPLYAHDFHHPAVTRDDLNIDYRKLSFKTKLDEGNFGVVYLASYKENSKECKLFAVKQLKHTASKDDILDFEQEINTYKKAGVHKHIVHMIGYCRAPYPLSIIMEYMPFNLLRYLKILRREFCKDKGSSEHYLMYNNSNNNKNKNRIAENETPANYTTKNEMENIPLTNISEKSVLTLEGNEFEYFALQIARGMEHLEANGIVHRDLAARNVLMDNQKILKISDFGMSRIGIYVNKSNRKFPLRWMSPETITNGIFSNKSDVWSYGVLLWEIGTLGGFPYSELQNEEVIWFLQNGGHLDRPESIKNELYDVMLHCWSCDPQDRPTFSEVVEKVEHLRTKAYVDLENFVDNTLLPPTENETMFVYE